MQFWLGWICFRNLRRMTKFKTLLLSSALWEALNTASSLMCFGYRSLTGRWLANSSKIVDNIKRTYWTRVYFLGRTVNTFFFFTMELNIKPIISSILSKLLTTIFLIIFIKCNLTSGLNTSRTHFNIKFLLKKEIILHCSSIIRITNI
jgi:hypothetical protein